MIRILGVAFAMALVTAGADDSWDKVKALKSGQELRILRRDAKQPVLAKMDEATAESLVVVLKDQQVSIPKDQIDRIDARPVQKGPRVAKESKTTTTYPDRITEPAAKMNQAPGGPSSNSSTGYSFGGKPDFELVYRRATGAPAAPSAAPPK